MQKTKEALYQSIGEVISTSINDDWNEAWVTYEVLEKDVHAMECTYEAPPNNAKKTFTGGLALSDLFLELRQAMEEDDSGSWKKATLELSKSGKFDLDFVY